MPKLDGRAARDGETGSVVQPEKVFFCGIDILEIHHNAYSAQNETGAGQKRLDFFLEGAADRNTVYILLIQEMIEYASVV